MRRESAGRSQLSIPSFFRRVKQQVIRDKNPPLFPSIFEISHLDEDISERVDLPL